MNFHFQISPEKNKKDNFFKVMDERNVDSVFIRFPEACWMKTKKESFDFAFNLQEIMTENHIIFNRINAISDLNCEMTNKFLDKRYKIHYQYHFSRSEGINGFLKGDVDILKLIGTTKNAVDNEIQLRNIIYNLTKFKLNKNYHFQLHKTLKKPYSKKS